MEPTGLGRYVNELVPRLVGRPGPVGYRVAGSPPPAGAPVRPEAVPVKRSRLPRKVLHPMWTRLGWPPADRLLGRPDLVHILYPATPVPTRAALVCTVHDLFPVTFPQWFTPKQRWLFVSALRQAVDRAAALVAVSAFAAAELARCFDVDPSRVEVIPVGVGDRFFEPVPQESVERICLRWGVRPGGYLLAVGEVSARKNLAPLVEALSILRGGGREVDLLVAGPAGRASALMEAASQRHGVAGAVRLTGWLAEDELVALLSGAAALAHPAVVEGFGLPPLEAMAVGTPAVASDGGSLPEVVGDAGVLVDPHSAGAWAEALDRVLDDRELVAALVDRGRRRAEDFRWDRIADRTAELHRKVSGV